MSEATTTQNPDAESQGEQARDTSPNEPKPSDALVQERLAFQLEVWKRTEDAKDVEIPTTLRQKLAVAKVLAEANLLPKEYRKNPENVLLAWQTAEELGLPQMLALRLLNVVEGTPALGAEGCRAVILARGHEIWTEGVEYNSYDIPISATVRGKRAGSERVYECTWRLDQAQRAGLCTLTYDENVGTGLDAVIAVRARSQNNNPKPWETYTEAMLVARATTTVAREGFSDATGGLAFERDELTGPGPVYGEIPDTPATPAKDTVPDDLALFSADDPWWKHANSGVRRRTKQQQAADRLNVALYEKGDARVPAPGDVYGEPGVPDAAAFDGQEAPVIDGELAEPAPDTEPIADAPVVLPSREEMDGELARLAEERGKSIAQLSARWVAARKRTLAESSDEELAAFLSEQRSMVP